MLLSGIMTIASGKSGITAICSFKIVWLLLNEFKTLAFSLSFVYITSLNSRGRMDVLL